MISPMVSPAASAASAVGSRYAWARRGGEFDLGRYLDAKLRSGELDARPPE